MSAGTASAFASPRWSRQHDLRAANDHAELESQSILSEQLGIPTAVFIGSGELQRRSGKRHYRSTDCVCAVPADSKFLAIYFSVITHRIPCETDSAWYFGSKEDWPSGSFSGLSCVGSGSERRRNNRARSSRYEYRTGTAKSVRTRDNV